MKVLVSFSEWLRSLEPEFYILFIGGFILFILIVIILVYVARIVREIASRTMRMNEEIIKESGGVSTIIKIINKSYIDNQIRGIGILYHKKKYIINEDEVQVEARNKHELIISHSQIRQLLSVKDFKIDKVKLYYENSIGHTRVIKGRLTRREIKQALKLEYKQFKQQQKEDRFESGNFNACDRMKIFFNKLCEPMKYTIAKNRIKQNKKIADRKMQREVEREQEKLIQAQRLIYEREERAKKKAELEKELQLEELRQNLKKMESNENAEKIILPTEETIEQSKPQKQTKTKKTEKPVEDKPVEKHKSASKEKEIKPEQIDQEVKDKDEPKA